MRLSDMQIGIIQFSVTCIFFYIEALLHYNIGKTGKFSFNIPPLQDNFKIISIIALFAAAVSAVTYLLEMWLSNSL